MINVPLNCSPKSEDFPGAPPTPRKTTVFTCILLWGLYDACASPCRLAARPMSFSARTEQPGLFGRFASAPQTPQRDWNS